MIKRIFLAALLASAAPGAAWAGQAGDLLRQHLYDGTLADGVAAITPLAETGDDEAQFSLGMLQFVQGFEHLAQALYRHGFTVPDIGVVVTSAVPIPANPHPEPLDYSKVRDVLTTLVTDMDAARTSLEAAGEGGDYVVEIDPLRVRIDIDGDGIGSENESAAAILTTQLGITPPEGSEGERKTDELGAEQPPFLIGLDRADAFWLAGYSQVFAGQGDFLLAHDFSDLVNATFHRLFPRAGLPLQGHELAESVMFGSATDTSILDAVALIHTVNWPVIEPDRLRKVRQRFKAVLAFSRRNWDAILSETDDNHELVPSPKQTPLMPEGRVTDEMVAAWRDTLDKAEAVLDGKLLLPHWRFKEGFDLKAYFEKAERTDLVLIVTGLGALPYLKDGPKVSAEDFQAANDVFGENILGYAFYFN